LDYYDVSEEVLASYLQAQADSPLALNLRACNYFRQYDGKGAERELKNIKNPTGNMGALVKHNQVIKIFN
jgi:intraflagellar transport protein 56